MPAVCFYFQVHQPYRLRKYTHFDIGSGREYFDEGLNRSVMERVAEQCYLPANECLSRLIRSHNGKFKVAFSISGTAVEQMKLYAPEVLRSFKELAKTGCVEFLGETYYHSLAMLYDPREYREQVRAHSALMQAEFGQRPRFLRNTELIFNDELGRQVADLGFDGVLAEGAPDILGWRSPNFSYRIPNGNTRILLKNFKLSDDIAFRFSHGDDGAPLSAETYAARLHELTGNAEIVGLFLDYETFGEHHKKESGILNLLSELPERVLANRDWSFILPSESLHHLHAVSELSFPRTTSWADTERDIGAWCGNKMQQAALAQIYSPTERCAGREVYSSAMEGARETWRKLQTSDHFYYMSTKGDADGDVHRYFSPFQSPYDAFIAYMNVLKDFSQRCQTRDVALLKTGSSE